LNLWSIVLLTNTPDLRYCEPFEQMARAGLLPGFIEIYIERDLRLRAVVAFQILLATLGCWR
jgi:hypothetical protein